MNKKQCPNCGSENIHMVVFGRQGCNLCWPSPAQVIRRLSGVEIKLTINLWWWSKPQILKYAADLCAHVGPFHLWANRVWREVPVKDGKP